MSDRSLLNQLVDALRCLPGVGPKSAQRMAFHLLERDRDGGRHLARVMAEAMERVRRCDRCRTLSEQPLCGLCANPNFHGHSYTCDVTVAGPVDEETGFVVDLRFLDRVMQREVRDRFDHRNISLEVPEFADGKLIPTGENLAKFICERLQAALAHTTARVIKVRLSEDATLSSAYEVDA